MDTTIGSSVLTKMLQTYIRKQNIESGKQTKTPILRVYFCCLLKMSQKYPLLPVQSQLLLFPSGAHQNQLLRSFCWRFYKRKLKLRKTSNEAAWHNKGGWHVANFISPDVSMIPYFMFKWFTEQSWIRHQHKQSLEGGSLYRTVSTHCFFCLLSL